MRLRVQGMDNGKCFVKPLRDMASLARTIRNLATQG
jgi:hypothetical protein